MQKPRRYKPPRDIALAPKPGFNDGQSTFTGLPPEALAAEPEPGDSITFTGLEGQVPVPPSADQEGPLTVRLTSKEDRDEQLAAIRAVEDAHKKA